MLYTRAENVFLLQMNRRAPENHTHDILVMCCYKSVSGVKGKVVQHLTDVKVKHSNLDLKLLFRLSEQSFEVMSSLIPRYIASMQKPGLTHVGEEKKNRMLVEIFLCSHTTCPCLGVNTRHHY